MKRVQAAGGLVLNQFGELLLICRRSKWDLPKGHREKHESLEACALREVKEETGLKIIQLIKYIGKTEYDYYDNQLRENAIKETFWYEMLADKHESFDPQLQESIEWVRWVEKQELIHYLRNSYPNIVAIIHEAGLIE